MELLERSNELEPIFLDFDTEPVRNTIYMLIGPRGCGKTTALNYVLDTYRQKNDFVAVKLEASDNMLEHLAKFLYEEGCRRIDCFKKEFSFSFNCSLFNVDGDIYVSSVYIYLNRLFGYYEEKGIKILVVIDDVTKCIEMVDFIRAYQGFLIDHHDIRLLLASTYKDICELERERSITFTLRTPKIMLSPLPLHLVSASYQSFFKISEDEPLALAKLTKGYAFGYQALGDILYRSNKTKVDKEVLREFDNKLAEWSYEMIWSELSDIEKQILPLIAGKKGSNQSLMKELNIGKGNLAIYKKQLANEGLIDVKQRGVSSFLLPRFDNFILLQKKLLEM